MQFECLCTLVTRTWTRSERGFIDRKALRWRLFGSMTKWYPVEEAQPCVPAVRQGLAWNTRHKQETTCAVHTPNAPHVAGTFGLMSNRKLWL
jgi:hypothetical protein